MQEVMINLSYGTLWKLVLFFLIGNTIIGLFRFIVGAIFKFIAEVNK